MSRRDKARLSIAQAALEVIEESGDNVLWFGNLDAWHEAYERAGGTRKHPMSVWDAVRSALNASPLWRRRGTIRAVS